MPDPAEIQGLDLDDFWVCTKHDRWCLLGYPCPACEQEWREANPKRVAEIEKLVDSILRGAHRGR